MVRSGRPTPAPWLDWGEGAEGLCMKKRTHVAGRMQSVMHGGEVTSVGREREMLRQGHHHRGYGDGERSVVVVIVVMMVIVMVVVVVVVVF